MDFTFTEAQTTVGDLARGILEREVTPERLKAAEAAPGRIDAALWATLAEANLLGVAIPEAQGGMGLGLLELLSLCEEVGRAVAPVPVLPALVLAGLPIARFGTEAQREAWLRPLAAGETLLSAAVGGIGPLEATRTSVRAKRDGAGWVLEGSVRFAPAARRTSAVLVPAAAAEGAGLFGVDPNAPGVTLEGRRLSTREPVFDLSLEGVRVGEGDLLGGVLDPEATPVVYARACGALGACATQVGVSERALEITTRHLREREQFGAPLGSFPAVQQRAADAWIDLQAMRWTTWRAAWRLAEGLPAAREVRVARFWAAEGGSRIANTAQHLHGGLGVDVDYPIHRYFLWSKSLELAFGGAAPTLARLGRELAASGPPDPAGTPATEVRR
jgi:alkylation response protein AidB-like acyl-CoA dehydrogenase